MYSLSHSYYRPRKGVCEFHHRRILLTSTNHCITLSYHSQVNRLVECKNRTDDCVQKFNDEYQNWLELLDGRLLWYVLLNISSIKYAPFCMMNDRDPAQTIVPHRKSTVWMPNTIQLVREVNDH